MKLFILLNVFTLSLADPKATQQSQLSIFAIEKSVRLYLLEVPALRLTTERLVIQRKRS